MINDYDMDDRDILRPFVIRESSIDELCKVISALVEDVRSQMQIMNVPALLLKQLMNGLNGTVNDAKERLCYCAEMKIRLEVQLFEPLPSHLAYPDILEIKLTDNHSNSSVSVSSGNHGGSASLKGINTSASSTIEVPSDPINSTITTTAAKEDADPIYHTWYPPLKHTLSLLSKLYGKTSSDDDV